MAGYLPAGFSLQRKKAAPAARPPPAEPGAEQELSCCFRSFILLATMSVPVLMTYGFFLLLNVAQPDHALESDGYFVAIDSVSGLTPAANPCSPSLDPAFNLTLRVVSMNSTSVCLEAGTYLEVSYRCVKLATSFPREHRLCVEPRNSIEEKLVARAAGVRVPWTVLDSLRADMRQGAPVFQVRFFQSGGEYADDQFLTSCGARRVGAAASDLRTRCNMWRHCIWQEEW